MSLPDDRSSQSRDRSPGSSRRTFLRRFISGLAIAVPALRTLAEGNATAASVSPLATCINVYTVYRGHYCSSDPVTRNCPTVGPTQGQCIGEYDVYDSSTGNYCWSFTDDEGICWA